MTVSSPGRLLICGSLAIHLLVLPPLPSGRERSGVSCDFDPYGGTDLLGMFLLFLERTADVMAPSLSLVIRRLVRLGSFPPCWRQANVTPIPKGPPSSSVANYRPISIRSVLSKVFERMVFVRLGRFMERNGVLPTTQFAYRKGLGTCDALLCVSHTLQVHCRVDRRQGKCRLIPVQPLIGLTIRAFTIGSALWVLVVLCCLY